MKRTALLVIALAVSLSGCAGFVRSYVFRPDAAAIDPSSRQDGRTTAIALTDDGLKLAGWYWPPATPTGDIVVFFHGNGGNRDTAAEMALPLRVDGRGLLVASYRGYGSNPGRPSEKGLMLDGAAFLRLARELAPGSRLFAFGFSLGSSVALEQAAKGRVNAVAVAGAFANLADVTPAVARPFLPDRFDNLGRVRQFQVPMVIIHGTDDETVPFIEGEKLRSAARGKVTFLRIPGGKHHLDLSLVAEAVWGEFVDTR